jgi:hypothetical protein
MILQHQDNLQQALTILQTIHTDDLNSSDVYESASQGLRKPKHSHIYAELELVFEPL